MTRKKGNVADQFAVLSRVELLVVYKPIVASLLILSVPLLMAPTSAQEWFKQGVSRLAAKDYPGAVQRLTQAIAIRSDYAEAYAMRCEAKARLEEYPSAIADCNEALKLNPNSALAYFNRARARADIEDAIGAIEDFSEVIRLRPGDRPLLAEAYLRRGSSRIYYFGEKEDGLQDIRTAANLFRQQGNTADYQRAIKVLEILRQQDW